MILKIDNFDNIIGKGINGWHVVDVYLFPDRYAFHIKAAMIGWIVGNTGNNIVNEVTVVLNRNKQYRSDKPHPYYELTTQYVTNPLKMLTEVQTKDVNDVNRFIHKLDKHITNLFNQ